MPEELSSDQQRLRAAETSIGVLQSTDVTFAKLLDGIATTLKELKASTYPPFSDVLRNAGIVAGLVTSILVGNRYLVNQQINEATKIMEYRLMIAEKELKEFKDQAKVTYSWRTITETR